jgi:putative ABC transport system permease protein
MIKNYIKTAFRSLLKNKGFTAINILGLALGLATCLLIVFYVLDELSYDRYNDKYERIFRVNTDLKYHGNITSFAIAAAPVGEGLVNTYPEVEKSVRITPALNIRFRRGNEILSENNTYYSEPNIFDIFTFPMIYGDFKTALKDPNSIVITESIAKKYFNRTNVVGQTLLLATDSSVHKITGVIRDIPVQSHFKADFLLHLARPADTRWNNISPLSTYILLKPGTDYKRLEAKFDDLMRRNASTPAFDYKKFEQNGNYLRLNLIPLKDIHLRSNRVNELGANGNIQYVYIFSFIAIFILLLACINFMNLSTARSANRAREVGVRKVLGSRRKYLIAQFLSESLIITFAATIVAVLVAWILLPVFNHISGKDLIINLQTFTWLLPSLVIIILVVGILAGAYPAFFLSAFRPLDVLKGKLSAGFKGGALRSFLVVFQFSISVFLIISTMVIYNQLIYIQNKDLGFNRSQVLVVKNAHALENPKILKQEIKEIPGIINATLTSHLPVGDKWPSEFISKESNKGGVLGAFWPVDEDYLNTMGMKLKKGRNFSRQFLTDSSAVIINETAAKILGYGDDPLNKEFYGGSGKKYHVIGVVKDFNFHSLRDNISPLAMVMDNDWMASLSIKVNTHNLPALMRQIERKWKALAPNQDFEYSFMDDDFNTIYHTEQRMGNLFVIFTSLAIIIACLGLFGLAAYAAEQRNREIGIRKILGANISTLVAMLSKDFIKLVVISIFIATPLAWWIMHQWLQGFAYRQNIQWWEIASASVGAIVIAWLTISFQSIKAAMANPVKSLRSE